MTAAAIGDVATELVALLHLARRLEDNLRVNESRIAEARAGLAGLDDPSAREACLLASRALDDVRNALYGALDKYQHDGNQLVIALRG